MSLTEPQRRALADVAASTDGLVATGSVRDCVLNRLRTRGLVDLHIYSEGPPLWRITPSGRALATKGGANG